MDNLLLLCNCIEQYTTNTTVTGQSLTMAVRGVQPSEQF